MTMRNSRIPSTPRHSRVLIIGSGPAGYTAAIYASRSALSPVLIEGLQPGGQLTITTDVENWPGDASVQGPDLMARMGDHARQLGAGIVSDYIVEVDLSKRPFEATGDMGDLYTADSVIIATGANARWLGLESETRYRGQGVSACATCDGYFFRNKVCAVVGGGNTAVEDALHLANFASEVYLIHRRDTLRADKTNQARLFANPKVKTIWNAEVAEVLGDAGKVTGVQLNHPVTGEQSTLAVDGLFIAIGHDPATSLFKDKLAMDQEGYILVTPGSTATSLPGVFAAGDVQDKHFRQAVVSAGMGCMAALEAEHYLIDEAALIKKVSPKGVAPQPDAVHIGG
ncbi:MAG: thioredoxin-disulfide reductase [Sphingorhabdus sp.]